LVENLLKNNKDFDNNQQTSLKVILNSQGIILFSLLLVLNKGASGNKL